MMNRRVALAACAVSLAAAPAFADDSATVQHTDQLVVVTPNAPIVINNGGAIAAPTAPGAIAPIGAAATGAAVAAPQNEDWNDVSHINGTLVKVGERSDYILRYRKTNISSNPIGWMMGFYGLSVSHAVHPNVAVRVDANLFDFEYSTGYEFGASLPIYFRRVYSGPFIEPGIITRGFRSTYDDSTYYCDYDCGGDSSSTMVGPEVMFGWHFTFDSGLNIAAAFGIARNLSNDDEYGEDIEPAGYFRVGYAF